MLEQQCYVPSSDIVVETSKLINLKLVKAKKTSLFADLLGNWSNGVIGFGHFSCFPLWHTLFQTVDSWGPKKDYNSVSA